jgi:hypothetical protein
MDFSIKRGFRRAGLIPLDLQAVLSKLDVQLRTPTPVEEGALPHVSMLQQISSSQFPLIPTGISVCCLICVAFLCTTP